MATAHDSSSFAPAERPEADFGEAVERVYQAGHALFVQRVELRMAEARVFARSGLALVLAGGVALAGWFYFIAGLIDALAREYPRFAVEMSVGAFHLALASALLAVSRRGAAKLGDRS